MTFYASAITPHIYQSMQPKYKEYQALKDAGITAIASMNRENPWLAFAHDIFGEENVLYLPWQDDFEMKPLADFARMKDWYEKQRAQNAVILVHCSAGINRSTIGTIWFLMCDGMTQDEAYSCVLAGRPIASGGTVTAYQLSLILAKSELLEYTDDKGQQEAEAETAD